MAVAEALGVAGAQVCPGVSQVTQVCPGVSQVSQVSPGVIGLAVAEALGVAGAQVFLSSRRQHNVDRAVAHLRGRGLQVSGVTCHVGRAEERERMVQAGLGPYSVSKSALLGLVAALSPELLPRGIRINGVAPGLIQTRFKEKNGENWVKIGV
uniref:Uncharacterized protein n=1 Tax=Catharus ustulatus TaxID=91951 RepID=A0A8C3UVL3_CATUS